MANEQNLRPMPFNVMTVEQQKRIASMGGKVRSPAKKYAAQLRELKKKGMTDEVVRRLVEFMQYPDCSMLQIRLALDNLKDESWHKMDVHAKIKLIKAYIDWHKAHHGKKHNIKADIASKVFDVNINIVKLKD